MWFMLLFSHYLYLCNVMVKSTNGAFVRFIFFINKLD